MIFETANAKLNLSLDTLYKRDDGFHEVDMVMTTIDLSDHLVFHKTNNRGMIHIEVDNRFVPTDKRNLVYQVIDYFIREFNLDAGVRVELTKRIPISAGMAGGSSDAAATLRGMNVLFNLGLSLEELANIGAHFGSDIPFCVYNKTARCTGRGEKIQHIANTPSCWAVIAKPNVGVSTKEVYDQFDVEIHQAEMNNDKLVCALENKDYLEMVKHMGNDLELVTEQLVSEVKQYKETMINAGVDIAMMSGSGPTVFGLCQKERQANKVYNSIKGCCTDVYKVRVLG